MAFQNFIRVDAQVKEGQARRLRALEDQLIEQTLLVERLVNMSTQQAELLRQQKKEEAQNAADLRAAADASIAELARAQAQEQARISAELDAKLQASVTMIATPIAHIMDHLKQLHLTLPNLLSSTQDTHAKPSASTHKPSPPNV